MTYVKYDGPFDEAVFSAEDLKKVGVEGFKKTTFRKNEPVEVSDEAAEHLINDAVFGNFSAAEEPQETDYDASQPRHEGMKIARETTSTGSAASGTEGTEGTSGDTAGASGTTGSGRGRRGSSA